MTPVLARLRTFAHDHDYLPRPDPATTEPERVRDLLQRQGLHVRARAPANDAYAHRFELGLDERARAEVLIRFDLRAYVLLTYLTSGPLHRLAIDDASLRARCAAMLELLNAQGLEELGFDEACTRLSPRMLANGFIDDTAMAYFFESL